MVVHKYVLIDLQKLVYANGPVIHTTTAMLLNPTLKVAEMKPATPPAPLVLVVAAAAAAAAAVQNSQSLQIYPEHRSTNIQGVPFQNGFGQS